MDKQVNIRTLQEADVIKIFKSFRDSGLQKPVELYEKYLEEQEAGKRVVLVAFLETLFVGYVTLVWASGYPPFREQNIPEINDLNVLPGFRRRGIGTALMNRAEELIAGKYKVAGIVSGLYVDYGPAQQMFMLRGYIPDGNGIYYNNAPVLAGTTVAVDDFLTLQLVKQVNE